MPDTAMEGLLPSIQLFQTGNVKGPRQPALDARHFALEEHRDKVADLMRGFLRKKIKC
jgi:hypothetical protein